MFAPHHTQGIAVIVSRFADDVRRTYPAVVAGEAPQYVLQVGDAALPIAAYIPVTRQSERLCAFKEGVPIRHNRPAALVAVCRVRLQKHEVLFENGEKMHGMDKPVFTTVSA